jgi:hypothetical protein
MGMVDFLQNLGGAGTPSTSDVAGNIGVSGVQALVAAVAPAEGTKRHLLQDGERRMPMMERFAQARAERGDAGRAAAGNAVNGVRDFLDALGRVRAADSDAAVSGLQALVTAEGPAAAAGDPADSGELPNIARHVTDKHLHPRYLSS